jgi:eukaryotic-like serine/threonine-protein kinase
MVEPGTVLAGRYRLDKQLGAGGMGEVWQARDLTYERGLGVPFDVAVKLVHSTLRSEELKRFEQEAEILRKLEHPNIVRLLDTDLHEGHLFIVMELLADQDLGKILEREGRLPVRRTVELMRQAATGLSAVHAAGIVHRDLKPANLFVRPAGVGRPGDLLKIGDFGLARVSSKPAIVTAQGIIVGTWAYIAPERWLGTWQGEPSADLYSLGCVLYELLAGKTPFPANSMAVIRMHCEQIPQPLRSASQEIPAPLNDLVLRLLEKDPETRYASAAAVADALTRIRDDLAL